LPSPVGGKPPLISNSTQALRKFYKILIFSQLVPISNKTHKFQSFTRGSKDAANMSKLLIFLELVLISRKTPTDFNSLQEVVKTLQIFLKY
jgi:hypothetical protein